MTSLDRHDLNEQCELVFGHVGGAVSIEPVTADELAVLVATYPDDYRPPGPVTMSLAQARQLRDLLDQHIRLSNRGTRQPGQQRR
jgi:hypothetical protein